MQHARVRIGGHIRIAEGPKSTRPSRGPRVDYAQKMQEMQRASPGTASAKAEVALELLKSREFTSQTKAAAAVGVHESTLSLLKRQSAAPYAKFNRSGTRLVELPMGVTYVEELSFGPGGTTPGAAKARGLRNYCAKRAAMSAVARLRKAAEMATAGGSPSDDESDHAAARCRLAPLCLAFPSASPDTFSVTLSTSTPPGMTPSSTTAATLRASTALRAFRQPRTKPCWTNCSSSTRQCPALSQRRARRRPNAPHP